MAGTCKRQSELLESGIGELSLLPLFLDLKGKRALVIGASQGAKWKVELLGSAGAIVDQFDIPPKEMSELRNYSFVVADIADETEAAKFAAAAQKCRRCLQHGGQAGAMPLSIRRHRKPFAGDREHINKWCCACAGANNPAARGINSS